MILFCKNTKKIIIYKIFFLNFYILFMKLAVFMPKLKINCHFVMTKG